MYLICRQNKLSAPQYEQNNEKHYSQVLFKELLLLPNEQTSFLCMRQRRDKSLSAARCFLCVSSLIQRLTSPPPPRQLLFLCNIRCLAATTLSPSHPAPPSEGFKKPSKVCLICERSQRSVKCLVGMYLQLLTMQHSSGCPPKQVEDRIGGGKQNKNK